MLDLKPIIFKIAILPLQSGKLTPASPQCAIEKHQQLITELKLSKPELQLLR